MSTTIAPGTRISYEDVANPRKEGQIIASIPGTSLWAVKWDDGTTTVVPGLILTGAVERAARWDSRNGRMRGWVVGA